MGAVCRPYPMPRAINATAASAATSSTPPTTGTQMRFLVGVCVQHLPQCCAPYRSLCPQFSQVNTRKAM